ncbi:hypothetical protein GGU11DRAFT_749585 [Lentinula aff. detonsa]|nr:hypothetical protein GGU11DRAFT_749585 [Lentinula aff. detonsa]
MAKKRPPKRKRNITGLRNQSKPAPEHNVMPHPNLNPQANMDSLSSLPGHNQPVDEYWVRETLTGVARWFGYEAEEEEDEIFEEQWEEEWFDCEELEEKMFFYAAAMEDNIRDEDWVPESLRIQERKKRRRRERELKGLYLLQ